MKTNNEIYNDYCKLFNIGAPIFLKSGIERTLSYEIYALKVRLKELFQEFINSFKGALNGRK
jgi:hypothetical protein